MRWVLRPFVPILLRKTESGFQKLAPVRIDLGRVLVEGVNIAKKHTKPNPQLGEQGGIVDKAMPLDVSNVLVFNPKSKKGERVGFRVEDDGNKVRVFRGTGDVVDI